MHPVPDHPAIELLEPRIAPALVTFSYNADTGALAIIGSDDFDTFKVLRVGANHYRLETSGSSFLPGLRAAEDFGRVTSVEILGKGQADDVSLIDLNGLRSLTVDLGDGNNDRVFTSNLAVKGTVTIRNTETATLGGLSTRVAQNLETTNTSLSLTAEKTIIAGSILWSSGSAANTLLASSTSLSVAKGVQLNSLGGLSTIVLSPVATLAIGKLPSGESIQFNGNAGDDQLRLKSLSVKLAGGIRFDGGLGFDSLVFEEGSGTVTIGKLVDAGSIKFDGGGGDDDFRFAARIVKTASGIEFFGGEGANRFLSENAVARFTIGKTASGASLHITDGAADSEWSLAAAEWILKGGIQVAPGDGNSVLSLLGVSKVLVGKLVGGQSLLYNGGAGFDGLTLRGSTVVLAGGIEAPFSGDGAGVEISGDRLRIGKSATGVSLLSSCSLGHNFTLKSAAGKLAGALELDHPNVGGIVTISGDVSIGKNIAGTSVELTSGTGSHSLQAFGARLSLAGDVRFEGNGGNDSMNLSVDRLSVQGSIRFDGGEGTDEFDINSLDLRVGGSVEAESGADSDNVAFLANGRIAGDVNVDLGSSNAPGQFLIFRSLDGRVGKLSILGELSVAGASTVEEDVTIWDVHVGRNFTATFGSGNLMASFENLIVRETFAVTTGDGEDSIEFERNARFGNSVIGRMATIQTAGGNDTVLIGSPIPPQEGPGDSTRVRFLGGLTLDGGTGTDTRNALVTENDFPTTPVSGLETFEQVIAF